MLISVDGLKRTNEIYKILSLFPGRTEGYFSCPACGADDGAYVFISGKNPGVRLFYCPECQITLDLVGVVQTVFRLETRSEAIRFITSNTTKKGGDSNDGTSVSIQQ